MTRGLMSSVVSAGTVRQFQTPKRVGERERLDHLHGIEVVSLRLVHEVEPRSDDRDAFDRPARRARRDRAARRAPARERSRRAATCRTRAHGRDRASRAAARCCDGSAAATSASRRMYRSFSDSTRERSSIRYRRVASRDAGPTAMPCRSTTSRDESKPLVAARRLDRGDEIRHAGRPSPPRVGRSAPMRRWRPASRGANG